MGRNVFEGRARRPGPASELGLTFKSNIAAIAAASTSPSLYIEDKLGDIVTLGLMPITKEGMKWKGQQLREAGTLLSKHKHEMTKEQKAEIHERIVSIRANHDVFWGQYQILS